MSFDRSNSVVRISHYNDRMCKIWMLDSVYRGKTTFLKQTNTLKMSHSPRTMYYTTKSLKASHTQRLEVLERIGKRLLDIVCGAIIAVIFVIVFPFVAIAIAIDSPGSIFYKQERVGLNGKKFTIYKLRSMVQNAEREGRAQWAVKGDARITKVGNFIRKTRLDELPQAINILSGEMSIVGPRPERQQFIDKLDRQIPNYGKRLTVKPGLTGWAQVKYGYGSNIEDARIKLNHDLYYIQHQSLLLDLQILLRTFSVVFKMQGQ